MDAEFLVRSGSLTPDRIAGVETAAPAHCDREDASMNLAAIADMRAKFPNLDLVLIESAATISPRPLAGARRPHDLRHRRRRRRQDPLEGRTGITRSDLLVINKIDLAPYVGRVAGEDARTPKTDRAAKRPSS